MQFIDLNKHIDLTATMDLVDHLHYENEESYSSLARLVSMHAPVSVIKAVVAEMERMGKMLDAACTDAASVIRDNPSLMGIAEGHPGFPLVKVDLIMMGVEVDP